MKSLGAKPLMMPTPVWIVGTYDTEGKPNVMTAAWGSICCSKPPCVSVSLRKATYSYGNLMEKLVFTVSVPSAKYAEAADYFGMASGRSENKFEKTGLTPVRGEHVEAPYVGEFPMAVECRIVHHHELGLHTIFAGEILDVKVNEAVLGENGLPDIKKVDPIVYAPESKDYFGIGETLGRAFSIGKNVSKG